MTSADIIVQEDELVSSSTLFGTANPAEVLARAAKVGALLEGLLRKQKLVLRIRDSDHVLVEGWTLLGSMLGVFPVVVWSRPVLQGEQWVGWEARVEARTRGGEVVGAAEAECLRDEKRWASADDYAIRSMAQTRAVSKALRGPLGFVIHIAGFNPTPAEEMHADAPRPEPAPAGPSPDDVPFGDDGLFPPPGTHEGIREAQAKKLNVLVGQLRSHGFITTEQLWRACGRDLEPSEDGELHWAPLRDQLTKDEASTLIDRLDNLEAKVAPGGFYAPKEPGA